MSDLLKVKVGGNSYLCKFEYQEPLPEHLVLVEYFNKRAGASLSSGTINDYHFDSTCPLNIDGGAPYSKNNEYSELKYASIDDIIHTGTFTIEFFMRVDTLTNVVQSSPTAIVQNTGDAWICAICPMSNNSNYVMLWQNDTRVDKGVNDSRNWHHYEMSVSNGTAMYFIDGTSIGTYNISSNLSSSWFVILNLRQLRCITRIAQVAVWDVCRHQANFSVSYEPIAYNRY